MIRAALLSCCCNKTDEVAVAMSPGKEVFANDVRW